MKRSYLFALVAGALHVVHFQQHLGGKFSMVAGPAEAGTEDDVFGVAQCATWDIAKESADQWLIANGGAWLEPSLLAVTDIPNVPDFSPIRAILSEADMEIQYQANRWGDGDIDNLLKVDLEKNSANDFVAYISHYATRWFPGGFPPYNLDTLKNFRASMVKVMTLAVSAIRWVDATIAKVVTDPIDWAEAEATTEVHHGGDKVSD